jgi:diamine N-acetyltransferase
VITLHIMLTLRPATARDLEELAVWDADPDTSVWLSGTGRGWHERALGDPDQEVAVAEDEGRPIGFVVFAGVLSEDQIIELRRIVVRAAQRGAGRGRALLQAAVIRAYEQYGARRVWLDVKAGNERARALYESEDFAVTDIVVGAVTEVDGTPADLVVMTHRP